MLRIVSPVARMARTGVFSSLGPLVSNPLLRSSDQTRAENGQPAKFSAKFASVKPKCPILSRKCPTFLGHIVHVSFVFIHIPALNVLFYFPLLTPCPKEGNLTVLTSFQFRPSLFFVSCHSSLITCISNNSISFHQHRGDKGLTRVFSSTSWRGEKQTFFLYLLSLTYRGSVSFFISPLLFLEPSQRKFANYRISNNIDFCEIDAHHA